MNALLHELEKMSDRKVEETVSVLVNGRDQGLSRGLAGSDRGNKFGQQEKILLRIC
jgi:hypothetical protein